MKKIVSRVLEVLLTSLFYGFPAWLSATVAIFAFNQNFGVGLVIMLGLVVVQLIASMKISDLEWNEFSSFNFRDMGPDYKVGARFNIIFNLTRVGTIISSLAFLFKSGFEINPFGGLGLTISIVISVIALVLFLSISDLNHNYEYVRGLLAVLAIVLLLVFSYLYFGTQLIWIPALLILVFSYSKCFYELDDGEYGPFAFLAPILLGLTSVISTVIQFSQEIIGWIDEVFEMIGVIIMSFLTLKLLYVPLWVCFSALALAFIVRKIGTTITKKSNQNKVRLADLAKAAEHKEKLAKDYKEQEDARVSRANTLKNIAAGAYILHDDVMFVIERSNYFSQENIARILTHAKLFDAFVVKSVVKEQIFYQPRLHTVLDKYNNSFKETSDDETLNGLINVISNLVEEINKVGSFKGSAELLQTISNICKDFPQFKKK